MTYHEFVRYKNFMTRHAKCNKLETYVDGLPKFNVILKTGESKYQFQNRMSKFTEEEMRIIYEQWRSMPMCAPNGDDWRYIM